MGKSWRGSPSYAKALNPTVGAGQITGLFLSGCAEATYTPHLHLPSHHVILPLLAVGVDYGHVARETTPPDVCLSTDRLRL